MKRLSLLFTLLFVTSMGCQSLPATGGDLRQAFLGEISGLEELKSFRRLTQLEPGSQKYEKTRIEYLLERLRGSSNVYIRHGKPYSNQRAILHLRWKLFKYRSEVLTAEEFVEKIGSASKASGKKYLILTEEGKVYPSGVVFRNELRLLADTLQNYHQKITERKTEEEKETKRAEAAPEKAEPEDATALQKDASEADNTV